MYQPPGRCASVRGRSVVFIAATSAILDSRNDKEGKLSWGHCLHILDPMGQHIATVQQQVFTFLPKFDLYIGEQCVGTIRKEFTFLRPSFTLDFNGWRVEGSFMEWDYAIVDAAGQQVASVSKELFHWTDTYVIDVADKENSLYALMVVLAIDAEKCSRN